MGKIVLYFILKDVKYNLLAFVLCPDSDRDDHEDVLINTCSKCVLFWENPHLRLN